MQRKKWMQTVKRMMARRDDPYCNCSDGELDTLRHIPSALPPAQWETSTTWDDGTWPTYDELRKSEEKLKEIYQILCHPNAEPFSELDYSKLAEILEDSDAPACEWEAPDDPLFDLDDEEP